MGFHNWSERCAYCGFENMSVSSDGGFYFEAKCPVCGYERWTEEKIPENADVELAKSIKVYLFREG